MLLAALIPLTSLGSYPILGPLGRPAQAWFLGRVLQHAPKLAAGLHDEQTLKPYTISTLLDGRGYPLQAGSWLQPNQSCWLRVTAFDDQLSELLQDRILPDLPDQMTLYKMKLRVDGYTFQPAQHVWAGRSSFQELAQEDDPARERRRVRLEFISPTAFRASGSDIPLPQPGLVFRSLWQKWNAVAPVEYQIEDLWPSFAEDCILVNELTAVNTQKWTFAEGTRGSATGYTGTVGFHLRSPARADKWRDFMDGSEAVLASLARFAFFCGTGHHTTIGMGQTRRLG